MLLEPRGTQRLAIPVAARSSHLRGFRTGSFGRFELLLDVLNALNETAEEEIATDNAFSPSLGQPTRFVDPRRAMIGVRLNLGR